MHDAELVWRDNRRLSCIFWLCLLLTTASPALGARCGKDPSDDAAVTATRLLVDTQCDCDAAETHSAYLRCVRQVVKATVTAGGLPPYCASRVTGCASKSTCGKPDAVTCCRTTAAGVSSCRIARDADHCVAPRGGSASVGTTQSCCDGCTAPEAVPPTPATAQPTKTPTPLPGAPAFCDAVVGLPRLARIPFTTTQGAASCGTAGFASGPTAPVSGRVADGDGAELTPLGLGCLYTGALPPAKIPDGAASVLDVVGLAGTTSLTLAGSVGDGPGNCTRAAGPGRHCVNGTAGTDGHGLCKSDSDCAGASGTVGSCALDANCFFGPPVPVPNSVFSACAVSTFLTDLCGEADLQTNQTTLATTLSSRLYLTGDEDSPCPRCIDNKCSAGKNAGGACTPVGSMQTTYECPPDESKFIGTLTVALPAFTTSTSELAADDAGRFCPDQKDSGAFGLSTARRVSETGVPMHSSSSSITMQEQTLVASFCVAPTKVGLVDTLGHFPGVGALSVSGVVDLSEALPIKAKLPPLPHLPFITLIQP